MPVEILIAAAILTAVVTWALNRRQLAEAVRKTKPVAGKNNKSNKKSMNKLSISSWFRRGQTPKDEAQAPTDQAPTDQVPTDQAPTDEDLQTPTPDLTDPLDPFQAWVASTNQIDSELQTWVSALSDEDLKRLTKQLVIHCQTLGMELDWLLENQLHISPLLQERMPEIMVAYLTSCHKAVPVQQEAQLFKTYQAFDNQPENHREFARQLYAKLVENGLVTMSPSDLLHDDVQKRQEYIVSSIRQAANNDPVPFNQALKAVVGAS